MGATDTYPTIVLIPAHNEEDRIAEAIRAVLVQTVPVDRVVVVADNCTDATVAIARSFGSAVEVFETRENRDRKAGALNQALAALDGPDETRVLVMDADSRIVPEFVAHATAALAGDVGAVGGIFLADGENGLLGAMQGLEYTRYAREIARDGARARVLTGTATITTLGMFRRVRDARALGWLPGEGFYNREALTEDFELTLAIKSLGFCTVSPKGCTVVTETMGTWGELWRQRVRWQRGALQALRMYGVSRVTLPYIGKQIETGIGILAILALWLLTALSLASGTFAVHPFWLGIGAVFQAERVVSAWRAGWSARALASAMIPDLIFDAVIGAVYVACLIQNMTGAAMRWGTSADDFATKGA